MSPMTPAEFNTIRDNARHEFMTEINRKFPSYQTETAAHAQIAEVGQIIQLMLQEERSRLLNFFFEQNYEVVFRTLHASISNATALPTQSSGSSAEQTELEFNYTANERTGNKAPGPVSDENAPPAGYSAASHRRRHRNGVSGRRVLGSLHSSAVSRGRRRHRHESMNANRPPIPFPPTDAQGHEAAVDDSPSRESSVEVIHEQPVPGKKRLHDQILTPLGPGESSPRAMKKIRTREPLKSIQTDQVERRWSPASPSPERANHRPHEVARAVTLLQVHEDAWDAVRKVSDTSSTTFVGDPDSRLNVSYLLNSPAKVFEDPHTPATSVHFVTDEENNPPPSVDSRHASPYRAQGNTLGPHIVSTVERDPPRYLIWDPTSQNPMNGPSRASSKAPTIRLGSPFVPIATKGGRVVIKTEDPADDEETRWTSEGFRDRSQRVPLTEVNLRKEEYLQRMVDKQAKREAEKGGFGGFEEGSKDEVDVLWGLGGKRV